MAGRKKAITDLGGYFAKIARVYARDYGVTIKLGPVGTQAQVDLKTKVIYLPSDIDMAGGSLRQTIEGLLDHEVGHLIAEREFKGSERYSVFHERAAKSDQIRMRLLNIFEDARSERARKEPGVIQNLLVKNQTLFARGKAEFERLASEGMPVQDAELFLWALNMKLRMGEWPDWMAGDARRAADECEDIMERAEHMWCPRDCDRLATELRRRLADMAEPPPPPPPPDSDDGDSDDSPESEMDKGSESSDGDSGDDSDSPGGGDSASDDEDGESKDDSAKPEEPGDDSGDDASDGDDDGPGDDEGAGKDGGGGAGDEKSDDGNPGGDEGSEGEEEGEGGEDAGDAEGGSAGDGSGKDSSFDPGVEEIVVKILERLAGDRDDGPEAKAWATVTHELGEERDVARTYHMPHPDAAEMDEIVELQKAPRQYKAALQEARPAISTLVRRLTLWLRAQVPVTMLDQTEGDIDEDNLPYLATGERRIFETERPGIKLDTAWVILIDQSGSMGSGNRVGSRSYWTRVAAIALGEALNRCRIPFEMWGWDTDSRDGACPDRVHTRTGKQRHFQYKTFRETWPRVRQRTGNIDGHMENDDVEAIYFAARRLMPRKEKHKVLLVLTDGQPTHRGLRAFSYDFAEQQLRDTLERVRRAGITDIGVGIQSRHVERLYKHSIVVNELKTFAGDLVKLVRKAVTRS